MTGPSRAGLVALGLASTLLALGAAEGLLRFGYSVVPRIQVGEGETRLDDEVVQAVFDADPELIWRLKPDLVLPDEDRPFRGVVSNGQRLRDSEEVAPEKPADEVRILFLGDSVTFGWRLPLEQTFSEFTERALTRRLPGRTVRCINAGVPGYSLFQGGRLLALEGYGYRPDLVVLAFGPNDVTSWGGLGDAEQHARWKARMPPPGLRWSHLARFVQGRLARAPRSAGPPRPRLTTAEFNELLARIRDETRARGVALAVMAVAHRKNVDGSLAPGRLTSYQRASAELGRTLRLLPEGAPAFVDGAALVRRLARERRVDELFFDRVHPTARVTAALGDELAGLVAPWLARRAGAP